MPPKRKVDSNIGNGPSQEGNDNPPGLDSMDSEPDSDEETMQDAQSEESVVVEPQDIDKSKKSDKGKNKNKPRYPCPKCDLNCTSGSIQCRVCDCWYHRKCADMSIKMLNMFNCAITEGQDHCWACNHCSGVFRKLNQKVNIMAKELETIKEQGNRTEGRVEVVEKRVSELAKDLKEVKNKAEGGGQAKDDVFSELNDRELRKNNVLVHNIAEPLHNDPKERKAHDVNLVCEVFDYIGVKCQPSEFKFVTRAGERNTDKIRPVIVGLRDSNKRECLLNNAHKIRFNNDMKGVRIIPDLTKRQREEDSKVGREVDKRNEELAQAGDCSHHWRLVGQRGARTLARAAGERPQMGGLDGDSRKRGREGGSSGMTPPPQRLALNP